jgi:hypothetical protein
MQCSCGQCSWCRAGVATVPLVDMSNNPQLGSLQSSEPAGASCGMGALLGPLILHLAKVAKEREASAEADLKITPSQPCQAASTEALAGSYDKE